MGNINDIVVGLFFCSVFASFLIVIIFSIFILRQFARRKAIIVNQNIIRNDKMETLFCKKCGYELLYLYTDQNGKIYKCKCQGCMFIVPHSAKGCLDETQQRLRIGVRENE